MKTNCLLFRFPGVPGVRCVFGQRQDADLGGNISYKAGEDADKVNAARLELLQAAGAPKKMAETEQVHGVELIRDPLGQTAGEAPQNLPAADGMMTGEKGLALLIKTADCQPILIADASGKYIMALHAGWRGNRANFPQSAVERFCETYNLNPRDLHAVRGPSLGPENARFDNFESEWGADFEPWFNQASRCMDLWSLTRAQLRVAGIPDAQIHGIDVCTMKNGGQYFSWRREKTPGRQASLIWIGDEEE